MKRTHLYLWTLILSLLFVPVSEAFLYQLPILPKEQITQLTDEVLVNTYIDVIVEMEASQTFHQTSGFTPKQYQQHKDLLKYKIYLLDEIQRRSLEVPGSIKSLPPTEPAPQAVTGAPAENTSVLIKE